MCAEAGVGSVVDVSSGDPLGDACLIWRLVQKQAVRQLPDSQHLI